MKPLALTDRSHVLVLTGAGVSAESGVPTFRGTGGLWEGRDVTELASPEGFDADPTTVWRFYGDRRAKRLGIAPNPGHFALAQLEQRLGDRFLIATQNVDGLHRQAGSQRLLAIHGELFETTCERCQKPFADQKTYLGEPIPRCSDCGQRLRPNVVWFGEDLDPTHLDTVARFAGQAGRDLIFIAAGTSGAVWPAAGFVDLARANGGRTLLIDLEPSAEYAQRFDEVITGKSGEVLPALFAE